MQNKMRTMWGISLLLAVMLLSSLSATASLMPLQMLSQQSMPQHARASVRDCSEQAMQHQMLSISANCMAGQQFTGEQDCCQSAAKVSCAASCAVHSAVLIPQVFAQIQPLEQILFISQEPRVQARSVARSVYRPPIV